MFNSSAELSLNTSTRCLTSVPNDTRHHRFLVSTACPPIKPKPSQTGVTDTATVDKQQQQHHNRYGHDLNQYSSSDIPNDNPPLYVLRFHEEMNELAIDSQLEFASPSEDPSSITVNNNYYNNNDDDDLSTTIYTPNHRFRNTYNLSSCPYNARIILASGSGLGKHETALFRLPDDALREDDLDYYDHHHTNTTSSTSSGNHHRHHLNNNNNPSLNSGMRGITTQYASQVTTLDSTSSFHNRVTCVEWSPTSHGDDNLYNHHHTSDSDAGPINSAALLTLTSNHILTTYDAHTYQPIYNTSIIESNTNTTTTTSKCVYTFPKARWDPHNPNNIAISNGTSLLFIDLRCSSSNSTNTTTTSNNNSIHSAHRLPITDFDYNPNKPNTIATVGQDSLLLFWDLRYTSSSSQPSFSKPSKIVRGGHLHYATTVRYNPYHDQLIVTGGSDGMINLWRISSISSAPLMDLTSGTNTSNPGNGRRKHTTTDPYQDDDDDDDDYDDDYDYQRKKHDHSTKDHKYSDRENIPQNNSMEMNDTTTKSQLSSSSNDNNNDYDGDPSSPDIRVHKIEMREAVYNVAWSSADAWLYAALAYDGTVIVNHVPSEEKYKILL
jgi:hypothetical protein